MSDKNLLAELVRKSQSGDSAALNQLFNSCYNDIYYFALKTVKNEEAAYDITQESCIEIIKSISSLTNPEAFTTWSKQITYRRCTRYFDKNRDVLVDENEDGSDMFDALEDDDRDFIPDEALDREDFRKTIMDMINNLSEEQRTAVMLYYFDELSVGEIAQIQGVSEGTVKSRLNYARKSIKTAVEDYEEKNNIKLHSFGLLPLLLWLRGGDMAGLSIPAAGAALRGALGSSLAASAIGSSAAVAASASAVGTATAVASKGIAVKIIAAIVAVTVAIGGGTVAYKIMSERDNDAIVSTEKEASNHQPEEETEPVTNPIPEDFTSDFLEPYENQSDFKDRFLSCLCYYARFFLTTDGNIYDFYNTSEPIAHVESPEDAYYFNDGITYKKADGSTVLAYYDSTLANVPYIEGEILSLTYFSFIMGDQFEVFTRHSDGLVYYSVYDRLTGDTLIEPVPVVLTYNSTEITNIEFVDPCANGFSGRDGFFFVADSICYLSQSFELSEDESRVICECIPATDNQGGIVSYGINADTCSPIFQKNGEPDTLYYYKSEYSPDKIKTVSLPEGYSVSQIVKIIPSACNWLMVFDDGSIYLYNVTTAEYKKAEPLQDLYNDGFILDVFLDDENLARSEPIIILHMADNGLYEYKEKK